MKTTFDFRIECLFGDETRFKKLVLIQNGTDEIDLIAMTDEEMMRLRDVLNDILAENKAK